MTNSVEVRLQHVALLVLVSACVTVTLFTVTPLTLSAAKPPREKTELSSETPSYKRDIAPLFKAKCSGCHGEKRHQPRGLCRDLVLISPKIGDPSLLRVVLEGGQLRERRSLRIALIGPKTRSTSRKRLTVAKMSRVGLEPTTYA